MWHLPGPGLEPVSPALAGRFLTTAPPGKTLRNHLIQFFLRCFLLLVQLWCGLFKASLRSPVMTHHTLILSSAGFPRPQPRRHGLPGVQMCPTEQEWQASCWLGACVCTRPGAATRGRCVFAFHKLLSLFSKLDLLGGLSNTFCI